MPKNKRHNQIRNKITELCDLLPFPRTVKAGLDSQSILRLSISTLKSVKKSNNQTPKFHEQVTKNLKLHCFDCCITYYVNVSFVFSGFTEIIHI